MGAGQRPSYAALDAVTLDAYGTLVKLVDPTAALVALLREWGEERDPAAVSDGFRAEADYYASRSHLARDEPALRDLWRDCARVFLDAVGVRLDASTFAPGYVAALEFTVLPGVRESLETLRTRGLALAIVSNWDLTLPSRLTELGLASLVDEVVTSANLGVRKPDARLFRLALDRLGVAPARALHIGDSIEDETGAAAAGMRFAPTPLPRALARWA